MGGALSKLNWKHWAIIGVVVCAIIGGSLFFLLIKKQQEELVQKEGVLQTTQSRAAEKDQRAQQLAQAKINKRAVERRLEVYLATKMIPLNMTSPVERYHTMVRLWREQSEVLGPLMERHIASTGVRLGGGGGSIALVTGQRFYVGTGGVVAVPAPPATPQGIPNSGWYMLSLGNISVTTQHGFNHALQYIKSFSRAPRLVTIGAPTISGRSPNLNVTMPVNVYYYVKGSGGPPAGGGGEGAPPSDSEFGGEGSGNEPSNGEGP